LSPADAQRLQKAEGGIRSAEHDLAQARIAWAKLVRKLGVSAVARQLDVTPQAVSDRVRAAERLEANDT
jgi:predicted transcriptional regulator